VAILKGTWRKDENLYDRSVDIDPLYASISFENGKCLILHHAPVHALSRIHYCVTRQTANVQRERKWRSPNRSC